VLDLRYDGGGRISVATHLAGLIGGERTRGQTFTRLVHNDKNSRSDFSEVMSVPSQALGLSRLFVITTDNSASASELMINGLRPFMTVTTIGSRTFGKPVGQSPVDFCDKTLAAVTFFTRNSRGEGEYFDGLAADCPAPDDLTRDLGDALEGSLAEAFQALRNGRCTTTASAEARAQSLRRPALDRQPHRASGWRLQLSSD
jgi:carboxyl-terminal processing protease